MAEVRVLVLRSPGTNCDGETAFAFELAGAKTERIHVNRLLEEPTILDRFQILCVPGGFSYGDDLAAGRILGALLSLQLGDTLRKFRDANKLILGICNGFQVLLKTGLLIEPDAKTARPRATLAFNRQGRFEDRWVHIKMTPGRCPFLRKEEILTMPIAHAEGNFIATDQGIIDEMRGDGRINATYVDADGNPSNDFPVNPNGAMDGIAGISDSTGRIFALMPHPERHVLFMHHPQWTRKAHFGEGPPGDGLRIFQNGVSYFQ